MKKPMFLCHKAPNNIYTTISSDMESIKISGRFCINFSIENYSKIKQWVCKYMTTLEGMKGDIFNITNEEGGRIEYDGIKVKRSKPSKEDFIKILPGERITGYLKLKDDYHIRDPGIYKIQFKGSGINPDTHR